MLSFDLKPHDDILNHYFNKIKILEESAIVHERAVSPYFGLILDHCAEKFGKGKITFTFDFKQERQGYSALFPDGALIWNENSLRVPFAFWEAKDREDDLLQECQAKFAVGYSKSNILFQSPKEILLIQDGEIVLHEEIAEDNEKSRQAIVAALKRLFEYDPPFATDIKLIASFGETIGKLGAGMVKTLQQAYQENMRFATVFNEFAKLCREVLNPNIRTEAIQEMLIQHLLTVRIFNTVFHHPEFIHQNIIACKIEEVVEALKPPLFDRYRFLEQLDQFYTAIERTSDYIFDFFHKQSFLNVIYERFFQGFAVKVADTHGIVYTPQPVVEFMVKSVEMILQQEFGKSLASPQVHILDPFVGTGNFMVRVLQEIQAVAGEDDKVLNELKDEQLPRELAQLKSDYQHQNGLFKNKRVEETDRLYRRQVQRLQDRYMDILRYKYLSELHCNEVMLLPYYIACVNIEHAFSALCGTADYQSFEGICLVDTFGIDEPQQGMIGEKLEENVGRVENQRQSSIFVIIGNPPYNVGQVNENDNNKNRKYQIIDEEVRKTYAKHSKATNKNALADPYVKAIRWATNRIKDEGIVAFITNNGFLDGVAFDGMRKCLEMDFSKIYHLDLKGNARTSGERRRKEKGNVFDDKIRVGVGISFFIKKRDQNTGKTEIYLYCIDDYLTSIEKKQFLIDSQNFSQISFQPVLVDKNSTWLTAGLHTEFDNFIPLGTKEEKLSKNEVKGVTFKIYSRGVVTCRDIWAYHFDREILAKNMQQTIETYNEWVYKWLITEKPANKDDLGKFLDNFVSYDDTKLSWSRDLKLDLKRGKFAEFKNKKIRNTFYRPFVKSHLFFDKIMNEEVYVFPSIFPIPATENENQVICVSGIGSNKPFHTLIVNLIPCLDLLEKTQCFPFYIYAEDGTNRQENITDWVLHHFQQHYQQDTITKWDIFHYVYGLLHHPHYREKYAANLKRELPRIPLTNHFWDFSHAGRQLAELHLHYDQQPEYPLDLIHDGKIDWELKDKMRLSKDKTQINYNYSLTLNGIPAKTFNYRLGNRSALEWIIERYQVKTDERSQITNNPNQPYEPKAIIKLIGQIITVSLKTVEIVEKLPIIQQV